MKNMIKNQIKQSGVFPTLPVFLGPDRDPIDTGLWPSGGGKDDPEKGHGLYEDRVPKIRVDDITFCYPVAPDFGI